MNKSEIEFKLRRYKRNKVLLENLISNLEKMEKNIEKLKIKNKDDVISSMQLKSSMNYKEGGFSNSVSNPTEKTAIQYEKELAYINNDERELKAEIRRLKEQIENIRDEIKIVDSFFHLMNEKEKFIIKKFYIENRTWIEIIDDYLNEFGIELSDATLKRYRRNIIDKINEVFHIIHRSMTRN